MAVAAFALPAVAIVSILGSRPAWPATQEPQAPPFFFSGSGRLQLYHPNSNKPVDVRFRRHDGRYDPQALQQIRYAFRSHGDGREGDISLRLIELLSFVQARFQPRRMELMSGYRSPQHNAGIRSAGAQAAKASLHTEGLAADIKLTGVDLRQLWLQLRQLETGGIGYYRSGSFLHIDTGPARFWEESTSRVAEDLSAGNARVFARSEFDRYADLQQATIRLHSVTAFPLRLAKKAQLVGDDGVESVALAAGRGTVADGSCIAINEYAAVYELKVASRPTLASGRLILATCEPRIEKTPAQIESNRLQCGG